MNIETPPSVHSQEVAEGQRFEFGANWTRFLTALNDQRMESARLSLRQMLELETLEGKRFLDAGSGSGLFSLSARSLGAEVFSFDYDPRSVACTRELKKRYFPGDPNWTIAEGSVLDKAYLSTLGKFDIVYSWGVLHHTGSMYAALENVIPLVKDNGLLFISIYNDQGNKSSRWRSLKKFYNNSPKPIKVALTGAVCVQLWWRRWVKDFARLRPFEEWKNTTVHRGMSPWHDVVDWVGGYPFEVATPDQIFKFYRDRGFALSQMVTCGGSLGCNEFLFRKIA